MRVEKAALVGLCGRSGSGKGYVSDIFASIGIPSIDTDAVYRELISPAEQKSDCMNALVGYFGERVALGDNSLNRAAMRELVFGDGNRENLTALNRITHRYIREKTLERADELYDGGYDIILIDAPVLFESGFDSLCVKNICVTADDETSVKRIVKRDGISPEDAKKRLKSQIAPDELRKKCDYEIINNLMDDPREQIEKIAAELRTLYGKGAG